MISGSGWFVASVVALIGAAIALGAQRRFWPVEHRDARAAMLWRWALGGAVVVTMGFMLFGPAQQPAATAAGIDDKVYEVTPATLKVKVGLVAGEVMDMKVTERVEQGSGRVVSPAKLTAKITLKNTSTNQTVRLATGKIQYIDEQGKPMTLEGNRADPIVKFTSSERLDPGQETTESVDVDFPVEALKAKKLNEIRFEVAYVPSPYRAETVNFAVSIGEGK